jgi:hypothetical protein
VRVKQLCFVVALTGIDLLGVINEKISKLDRALRSVETSSNATKNQALETSERLRATAIENGWHNICVAHLDHIYICFVQGQTRQQVQQFAGVLAVKSTFQDQFTGTVKCNVR